jgi:transposase InsO family protein
LEFRTGNTMARANWKDCWNFNSRKPDFTAWQIRIRALLEAEDVWEVVNQTRQYNDRWDSRRRQEFVVDDKKAFQLLISSLDDATVKAVGKYKYSWSVYEHMERVYASKDTVSIYHARASFHNLKYQDGDDMQSHINDLEEKAEALARLGRPIDDEEKVMHMLGSLPASWTNLVMVCQNQKELRWRDLQTKLLLQMDTRKHNNASADMQAHLASNQLLTEQPCLCCSKQNSESAHFGQGSGRTFSGRMPFHNQQRNSRGHPYQRNDTAKSCNYCGKPGHFIKVCTLKARHDRERGFTCQPAHAANATLNLDKDDEDALDNYDVLAIAVSMEPVTSSSEMALQASTTEDPTMSSHVWVLDSGCTHHMCFDRSYFLDIKPIDKKVYLGNNKYVAVEGIGAAVLNFTGEDGKNVKMTLSKCFYLPAMTRNLLSVRCLREKGVLSDFGTFVDRAVIHKDRMRIKSMENTFNKLYVFKTSTINTPAESAYIGVGSQSMELWHSRCGHLSYQNIAKLVSRGRARGLRVAKRDLVDFPVCDVCERSNQQRASFKRTYTQHATQVNELVYTDIKGPVEVPTFSGKRYVLVFVDDFSGFVTTYLLAHKSEALTRFKEYVVAAETKHNLPVRGVNSDNGGEFISPAWTAYCKSKGIHCRGTTTYTPEQNGSAEVRFRVLFRKVRTLLIGAQLPKQFWGEALLTATLLNNISPLRRADITPYERWHGKEADYSNLRVFGSLAYTYVTPTHPKRLELTAVPGKRKTLDNRGIRGIFVGYAEGQKAWRVLHCGTNRIVTTCHATFDESGSPAATELKLLELRRLEKLHHLDLIHPSRLANSICDLVFYAEPVIEDNSELDLELQQLNKFIDDFKIDELRDERGELPDVSCYIGRHLNNAHSAVVNQRSVGTKPQALTICAGDRLSEKQQEAEFLVAAENIACKTENSKVSELATRVEPKTHAEAITCPDALHWRKAIDKEGQSLVAHGTWKLVPLPKGKRALTSKWIFKIKYDAQGNIERYKARLVIRGYEQVRYVDYDEIFAPVIRLESLRMLLALVAINDWECHQTDVDTAFLNGDMDEEVYMLQPEGLVKEGQQQLVCRLLKSLYGLKQAPRAWHKKLTDFLKSQGYVKLNSEACIYVRAGSGGVAIVGIYVDDLLLIADTTSGVQAIKNMLSSGFKCKDMGEVHHILGLRVRRDRASRTLSIDQTTYAKSVLEKFNLLQLNPCRTPCDSGSVLSKNDSPKNDDGREQMKNKDYRGLVGSLMYLMTGSRPDIAFGIQCVSKYLNDPGVAHWNAAKRILRYVKGTIGHGLVIDGRGGHGVQLTAYVDSDYAKNIDTRRSVSGYIMQLGDCAITYSCKSQRTVALSSTEAEYMSLAHGVKELIFLRELLEELGMQQDPTVVNVDNQSAIAMANNPVHHQRTKHIHSRYHFVPERIEMGDAVVEYVSTKDNVADLLTKAVTADVLTALRGRLGVRDVRDEPEQQTLGKRSRG